MCEEKANDPGVVQRRRRRLVDYSERPKVEGGGMEVREVDLNGRKYILRYVTCGKGCRRCDPNRETCDPERPGHGPYWYRVLRANGRIVRRYIGRELRVIETGDDGETGEVKK